MRTNQDTSRRGRARSTVAAIALASGLLGLMAFGQSAASERTTQVDDTRTALERWVETRRLLSQEKRDWALGREMLESRTELIQREIDSLRGKLADVEGSISEADVKLAELVEENERLKASSATLVEIAGGLEARTQGLLAKLPDPVRERVKLLSQRIPEDPAEAKQGLGERFQNVVGILNEVNKFNREITVTSEVRRLASGETAEVTALYVGIGQSYYVTATGDAAGVGSVGDGSWTWTENNGAAAAIASAVAILQGEDVASFVELPIRVD